MDSRPSAILDPRALQALYASFPKLALARSATATLAARPATANIRIVQFDVTSQERVKTLRLGHEVADSLPSRHSTPRMDNRPRLYPTDPGVTLLTC
jgi:3-dehydroquinate synthetase